MKYLLDSNLFRSNNFSIHLKKTPSSGIMRSRVSHPVRRGNYEHALWTSILYERLCNMTKIDEKTFVKDGALITLLCTFSIPVPFFPLSPTWHLYVISLIFVSLWFALFCSFQRKSITYKYCIRSCLFPLTVKIWSCDLEHDLYAKIRFSWL